MSSNEIIEGFLKVSKFAVPVGATLGLLIGISKIQRDYHDFKQEIMNYPIFVSSDIIISCIFGGMYWPFTIPIFSYSLYLNYRYI